MPQSNIEFSSMTTHNDRARFNYNPEATSACLAIVEAFHALDEPNPLDTSPLHDYIDAEAVTALVQHTDPDTPLDITFVIDEYTVTIANSGDLTIHTD